MNSEDLHDPDLALIKNNSVGGTLVLWNKNIDPYVSVYPVKTCSFTPIILKHPGTQTSIHIALYLPTHGKDPEFVSEFANLRICVEELADLYPDSNFFIRGDSNVNKKNLNRVSLLNQFLDDFSLQRVNIPHNTYHHFVGSGLFDSDIDVLLHSSATSIIEHVDEIICKHENPLILSHHDVILSTFSLPASPPQPKSIQLVKAPRVTNTRKKIVWSHDGVQQYQNLIKPQLKSLREAWLDPSSTVSMSVLLQMTNFALTQAASSTNEAVDLGKKQVVKSARTPSSIAKARNALTKANKKLKALLHSSCLVSISSARAVLKSAQKKYRQEVRNFRIKAGVARDERLHTILTENPSSLHGYIKSCKNSKASCIQKLTVGQKVYEGESVADGFFDSMSALKSCDTEQLKCDPSLADQMSNYEHILKICEDKHKIPPITRKICASLLSKLKKNVKDFYSITALHYVNAGEEGLTHFHCLLNAIIDNVNNASIKELNTAHGLILYKGHRKEKTSDRSYRTISTCPLLAKSLDLYLRDLYHELWDGCQAETQYQGTGSSHELASLLVTEVVQHSLYVKNKPVYLLALDAQSAFDRCLRQILVCELYKAKVDGSAIAFIDKRLANRETVYEWNGEMMGPAKDDTGFEQGGVNSSDYYKLYNNEQLNTAQASGLGVDIGSSVVSAIGLADDVVLAANDVDSLHLLVTLTEKYCAKYRVKLVPSKTKLLVFSTESQRHLVEHAQLVHRISIGGEHVKFVSEAEHVGVIRNISGNMPNILHRITAHKRAMGSTLSAGLARGHRGNPVASLKVEQLHGTSVLFSGLASLVLSSAEIKIIDHHYQLTVQNLQRLHDRTPRCLVFLMAGCLPGEALLHMKQLTLFSMICHLPSDPLNSHARTVLVSASSTAKSWFQQIRELCLKYSLEHPLYLLDNPPVRTSFKKLVKEAVVSYWENILREEASKLPSLEFFVPGNHSLQYPHPLWTTAGSNIFECHKSTVLAKMISGRYRTEYLSRHWTSNKLGFCLLDSCSEVVGDLEHLLIVCPGLDIVRTRMREMFLTRTTKLIPLHQLITRILSSPPPIQLQFLLEPSSFLELTQLYDLYGQTVLDNTFYLIRTYTYYLHREKQILLGIWSGDNMTKRNPKTKDFTKNNPKTQTLSDSTLFNLTNYFSVSGHQLLHQNQVPARTHSLPVPSISKHPQYLSVQHQDKDNLAPCPASRVCQGPAAWTCSGLSSGMSGGTSQDLVLDCLGGSVSCGGVVDVDECSHGSQTSQYPSQPVPKAQPS